MNYVVLTPFRTHMQKFRAGDAVSRETALAPHTSASLLDAKIIEAERVTAEPHVPEIPPVPPKRTAARA